MFDEMEGCLDGCFGNLLESFFQGCLTILLLLGIGFACLFLSLYFVLDTSLAAAIGTSGIAILGIVLVGFIFLNVFDIELPTYKRRRSSKRRFRLWDD